MTGGDREGQSVEAREECEDAGPGTSIHCLSNVAKVVFSGRISQT